MKKTKGMLLSAALMFGAAWAHETVSAGNVQVEWHTDTNEKLQVNAESVVSFTLSSQGKPISPQQCRCTLLLYKGKVSAKTRPQLPKLVQHKNQLQTTLAVTEKGMYTLVLDGKPKDLKDFAPFRLHITLDAVEDVFNTP